ncbi:Limulus clotting factor C [Harpegnathos saltator]|uniref:Limulus clotting factor C n=1 Tax=Harpegnathos saltator TaxID=610380 RepID=E2C7Y6_HARSA|nr:Limulus clotting factor C [Harpegnathos saltator]
MVHHNRSVPNGRNPSENKNIGGLNNGMPVSGRLQDYAQCREEDQKNGCALPEHPTGGRYQLERCELCRTYPGDSVPQHSTLIYTCNDGYMLSGSNTTICLNNMWFHNQISCLKICPEPKGTTVDISCNYRGEKVSCNDPILPGTRATLACKQFHKLPLVNNPGYKTIKCLDSGLWDHTIFRCEPDCGKTISQGQQLIVNGVKAKAGMFPWHVGIYEKDDAKRYQHICGGSLISNDLVISAAHCFYNETENKLNNASNYAVGAGKYFRSWDTQEQYSQKSFVEYIKLRQKYRGARSYLVADIALVKLQTPLNLNMLVRPVCMDWQNMYDKEQLRVGQSGKLAGWGKDITGKPTEDLYEVTMPYVTRQKCLDNVPSQFRGFITWDKFCAGRMNGSSACEGDSGGGLCFETNDIWYLRGVVSVSPQKDDHCDYTSYVAFTQISRYRTWIHDFYVKM